MSSPRSWLKNPAYFSKDSQQWKAPSTEAERAELRAAMWQQSVTGRLRGAAAEKGYHTWIELAKESGVSQDAISRIINGESWLDLRRVAMFEECLDVDLLGPARPDLE